MLLTLSPFKSLQMVTSLPCNVAKVLVLILFFSFTQRFDSAEEVSETKITSYGTTTRFIYDLGTSTEETYLCVTTYRSYIWGLHLSIPIQVEDGWLFWKMRARSLAGKSSIPKSKLQFCVSSGELS